MPASRSRVKQVWRSSWQVPAANPGPSPGAEMISSNPSIESGCPRRGPFNTTNSRSVGAPAGRSLFMYAATVAKKLGETGTSR